MIVFSNANRLFHLIVAVVIAAILISSCLPPSSNSSTEQSLTSTLLKPVEKTDPVSVPNELEDQSIPPWRAEFMAKSFSYFSPQSPPTLNFLPTRYYRNTLPKATVLGDYNQNPFGCWMAVNFGPAFEQNLPSDLLAELEKRHLRNKEAVDITWVIQPLTQLGGNTDRAYSNITYLKGHGWADPDSKAMTNSEGVKRNFLYGIFDADVDISHEVMLGAMKPFLLYTHYDAESASGVLSPQTAALRFPSATPDSMALWSLVIDSENPEGKVRAVATLHWLISEKDQVLFQNESFALVDKKRVVSFPTIGAYISMLQNTSSLKDTSLVKKLTAIIR